MIPSLLTAVLAAVTAAKPGEPPRSPPTEKGVALGLFSADERYDYTPLVEEIAGSGATHVTIAFVWWQDNLRSHDIRRVAGWTAADRQIISTMKTARERGLHVTAFPIVRLIKADKGEWRGKIAPVDEDRWWASYEAYILHAVHLAKEAGARRISIGSELLSRERDRQRWLALIDRVRMAGPNLEILYSANWDHFEPVSFWDAVDVVGVTGYWELTKDYDASTEALERAWQPIREGLARFSASLGRPIVITEVGYPSIDGGAAWPWDQTREAPIDLEEQRRAYEAFVRAWSGVRFLDGVYFWNWFGFAGPEDGDYTPRGKPAEQVIRRWYAPPLRASSATETSATR